jgi:hypothetical protein
MNPPPDDGAGRSLLLREQGDPEDLDWESLPKPVEMFTSSSTQSSSHLLTYSSQSLQNRTKEATQKSSACGLPSLPPPPTLSTATTTTTTTTTRRRRETLTENHEEQPGFYMHSSPLYYTSILKKSCATLLLLMLYDFQR